MQFEQPNLQSMFKKSGDDATEPSVWVTLRGGMGEPELNGAENATRGLSIPERGRREPAVVLEMEDVAAELLLIEPVGKGVEVISKLPDCAEVGLLSTLAQPGELEVPKQPLAEWRGP